MRDIWDNHADGILCISCRSIKNGHTTDFPPWICNSMRIYSIMILALYIPMAKLLKRQWDTNADLFQKEKLTIILMFLSNTIYFVVEVVVDSEGIYYIGLIFRTSLYLLLLYMLLERATELTETHLKFFRLANYSIGVLWIVLVLFTLFVLTIHDSEVSSCEGMKDPIIISVRLLSTLMVLFYVFIVIYLSHKFLRESYIMETIDELSRRKLSKSLKNLTQFTIVLSIAEGARIIESTYRAIRPERKDDDCLIIPKEYDIFSAMFWLFYHILTFWLPTIMIIRLLWISSEQLPFTTYNESVLSSDEAESIENNCYGKLTVGNGAVGRYYRNESESDTPPDYPISALTIPLTENSKSKAPL